MINNMLGKKEAGWYDIAVSMSEMVYLFPLVVSAILFPKLAAMEDIREKWKLSKNVGLALLACMVVICSLTAVLAHPLIKILFGESFLPCVPSFLLLIFSKFIVAANTIFSNFIASIYVPWTAVPFGFAVLGVNILLNLAWIDTYGIIGAAYASIASFALFIPFHYYYTMKYLRDQDAIPQ